jgi:hypothetical protein
MGGVQFSMDWPRILATADLAPMTWSTEHRREFPVGDVRTNMASVSCGGNTADEYYSRAKDR